MFSFKYAFDEADFTDIVRQNISVFNGELDNVNRHLNADMLFIGVRGKRKVSVVASTSKSTMLLGEEYALDGSPCEQVLNNGVCVHEYNVCDAFPSDNALRSLQAQGYIGSPLFNESGDNVGILVAVFTRPQPRLCEQRGYFSLFAKLISERVQKYYLHRCTAYNLSLLEEVGALSNTGAWEYHVNEDKLSWSLETFRIHGVNENRPLTREYSISFYPHCDRPRIKKRFDDLLKKGKPYREEFEIIDANGNKKWVRTSGKAQYTESGNLYRVFGAFEDITDYKQTALLSRERSIRIQNILDNINDAVISVDTAGVITHCNKVALRIFGYTFDELVGLNIGALMPEPYASNHAKYVANYEKTGEAQIMGVGRQLPAKRKNGEVFQMELSLSEATEAGKRCYIGVVRDISERIQAQDTIYNLAYTDPVTRLHNKQWFQKECKDLMLRAKMHTEYIHVLLLDMDNMSQINTRLGFANGNSALRLISEKLSSVIGHEYRIYKFDGDSFIVLAKKTYTKANIHRFDTELIENALLNPRHFDVVLDDATWSLSASLGSAIFNPRVHSFESVLNILEHALKTAKTSAPFGLCHVSEDGIEEFDRYLAIKGGLKQGIEHDEFSVVLQPQVDQRGEITSFESLVRWNSTSLGQVSPADFIPIAEESVAICEIGNLVIDKTLSGLAQLIHRRLDMSVAINISARQIVRPDFASTLIKRVNHYNIAPQLIVLELTETALVADIEVVKHTMVDLAGFGFRFSVDDFGTGYSSLAYLKELPISELKIDKYFVDDICEKHSGRASPIVDAIIEMAKALEVTCIAEGVETKAQLEYLTKKGCDRFQGYYFSKPKTVDHWLQNTLGFNTDD